MGGQLVTYLDHHMHGFLQELQRNLLVHLLAQQRRYRHHLELTLQHLHIQARYLHRQL